MLTAACGVTLRRFANTPWLSTVTVRLEQQGLHQQNREFVQLRMAAPSVGDQLAAQAAALPSDMAARVLPPLTERPDVPGLAPAVAASRGIFADHAVVRLTVAGSAYTRPRSVMLFVPPDFPASRPKIRFIGVLQHVQVRAARRAAPLAPDE